MARKRQLKTDSQAVIWFDLKMLDRLDPDGITESHRIVYSTLLLRPGHDEFPDDAPKTEHCSQEEFARLVHVDPSQISRALARGILTPALPWRLWSIQWISYHVGVAAGRRGTGY